VTQQVPPILETHPSRTEPPTERVPFPLPSVPYGTDFKSTRYPINHVLALPSEAGEVASSDKGGLLTVLVSLQYSFGFHGSDASRFLLQSRN
jgi:hypothetical protein